jgi:hypothetical protein
MEPTTVEPKEFLHVFRTKIDECIKIAEADLVMAPRPYGREMSLVRTKLQEAKMWAGKCLEFVDNNDFPEALKDEAKMEDPTV